MKSYDSKHIKNIVLLGHAGSGKTTLAETMLFEAGKITRRGTVEDKNTVSDYHEIEHERTNSIFSSLLHVEWRDNKINILDTPGMDDFIGDVISSLKVADTGVMVLNSQYGVEVGTEIIWSHTKAMNKPMIFAVNQVDQEKSDFDRTVEQAKTHFGANVTVIQYPLNQGQGFDSIIDVLKMTMYKFPADGGKPEKLPIPDSEKAKADALHNDLVESVAENDESLMELYFEKGSLDEEEMRKGLRIAVAKAELYPVFCVSAKNNMGTGRMMGFIGNVAPCPLDMPATALQGEGELACDPAGPTTAFVYKLISEQNTGVISYFKIFSGELASGSELYNQQTRETERFNQLYVANGKTRETVDKLAAGDIGATVKLKKTHVNHTLHPKGKDMAIEPIHFPDPVMRSAVAPAKTGEEEKLANALHTLHEEDPTLILEHSIELKQMILHGQGELQLNMVKWRLNNSFHIDIVYSEPRIPYRETISKASNQVYRHKKQSGGAGQFAEVHMLIEPYHEGMPDPADLTVRNRESHKLEWGGTLEFLWCIVGGSIDSKFSNAIQKGIMEKMVEGPITGCHVRDVRVSIYDGKMHPVDSNDMAFKTASMMAFKDGFLQSGPKLLEPIYDVEVLCPDEILGDIMSDLQTRRAIVQGMEAAGANQKIKAKVPLAELYKYSSTLRSLSQGRAKHSRKFSNYEMVPGNIQNDVIAKAKEELAEA